MDNKTPKYANWVPEAGGYVANGNVVSKSPQYDESGKLKLNIDTSLFTPQKVATSSGVTQANTEGSKVDVNSSMTTTGSLGSLNINTDNPMESVISSPATKSPVAGEPILSMEDQTNKEYQDAAARGDYQGMINALVSRQNQTGVDQSAEIERLTKMREEKIRNIDDQYIAGYNEAKNIYNQALRNYNEAVASGDEKAVAQAEADLNQAEQQMAQIVNEQSTWRDQVGYQDTMQVAKQRDLEENKIRWVNKYLDGVDEIAGSLIQLVGNYMNFQYDPYSDPKLARAQAYTKATMTEHFSNTGMYNSSSVAYAITQAVAELVPVYEQMAKDEIKDNINMLQSTANFLINLEESQFDMWRAQVQLQFAANEEKRKEIDQAIQTANARGYYTNDEAAKVGVAPGSLSQKAREHEQELLEEIDKERRTLQQQMVMADYNQKLKIDLMEEENRINKDYALFNLGLQKDYWQFQVNNPKQTSTNSNSGSTSNSNGAGKTPSSIGSNDGQDIFRYEITDDNGNTEVLELSVSDTLGELTETDEDGNVTYDRTKVYNFLSDPNTKNLPTDFLDAVIPELRDNYLYAYIDDQATRFGDNYKNTKKGLDNAIAETETFMSAVENLGANIIMPSKDAINKILSQVDNASTFDFEGGIDWFSIQDDNKGKNLGKEYVYKQFTKGNNHTLSVVSQNLNQNDQKTNRVYVDRDKVIEKQAGGLGYYIDENGEKHRVVTDTLTGAGEYYYTK